MHKLFSAEVTIKLHNSSKNTKETHNNITNEKLPLIKLSFNFTHFQDSPRIERNAKTLWHKNTQSTKMIHYHLQSNVVSVWLQEHLLVFSFNEPAWTFTTPAAYIDACTVYCIGQYMTLCSTWKEEGDSVWYAEGTSNCWSISAAVIICMIKGTTHRKWGHFIVPIHLHCTWIE